MPGVSQRSDLLKAAMALSEDDREALAYELLETLTSSPSGLSLDDPELEEELKRRSGDWAGTVPAAEIWSRAQQ